MKVAVLAVFTIAASVRAASPVAKVIELLTTLEGKITAEGDAAKTSFEEFSAWCKDTSKNLGFDIKTGKAKAEDLQAVIEEETAVATSLSAKIEDLGASLSANDADLKSATEIRATENSDFTAAEKELVETIDMLERAITIIQREMQKSGASFLQGQSANNLVGALTSMVQASVLSSADAQRLTALVQSSQQSDDDAIGAPDAAVYESHSGNIVDTLEDLLDKAQTQLSDARQKEAEALHNFEMLKQGLEDQIKFSTSDMADAKKNLAASGEKKATAESDLATTSKGLDEDSKSLEELKHDCMTKSQDYEAETKSRSEELAALAEAKKVISETTAGAEAQSYGFAQVSLLQVGRATLSSGADLANFEAVRLVRDLARKEHSTALAQIASRMASLMRQAAGNSEDPFGKVKDLISGMLEKLEDEASADAAQKAYCDKETSETKSSMEEKTAIADKLTTKIDQSTSRAAQLKEEIATVSKSLVELAESQATMDKMRTDEKAAYTKNKAEMEQGIEGVKMALKVLMDYYASGDKAHESAEGAGHGIIGLLEVVESDFSKGLTEMVTIEETAATEYEQQTKENELEKATKDADKMYKTKELASLEKAVTEHSADRSTVQSEIDALSEYMAKLEDMCVAKPEPYEERKKRRETEIAGLKQALQILEGEAVLLQSKRTLRETRRHVA